MFGLLGAIGSVASLLGGVAPAISSYFTASKQVEAREFAAMTAADRDEYISFTQAISSLNASKVANNTGRAAHVMVYLFGVPAALHWGATFFTATFPQLGFHTDPLSGSYAVAEKDIAESFFLLAPTIPVVGALASRLRG